MIMHIHKMIKALRRGLQAYPQTCTIYVADTVKMQFKPITDGEPQELSMPVLLPAAHPILFYCGHHNSSKGQKWHRGTRPSGHRGKG